MRREGFFFPGLSFLGSSFSFSFFLRLGCVFFIDAPRGLSGLLREGYFGFYKVWTSRGDAGERGKLLHASFSFFLFLSFSFFSFLADSVAMFVAPRPDDCGGRLLMVVVVCWWFGVWFCGLLLAVVCTAAVESTEGALQRL